MINLRDPIYATEYPTEEKLFEIISDYDVFNYYIEDFQIGGRMLSPLRKEDNPSFSVFWSSKNKCLLFKDFKTGQRGGAVKFVSEMFGINYISALEKIIIDFRLQETFMISSEIICSSKNPVIHDKVDVNKKIVSSVQIGVTIRDWNDDDRRYWTSYGITKSTLIRYNVFPIKYIFLNDQVIIADKLAYAYVEMKDGEVRYKIYQPYSVDLKWINNFIEGTISGFAQLPTKGNILTIASSLKDGMCLLDNCGLNFIAPQTENYIFKPHIIDNLKSRFDHIIIFYDEDSAGIKAASRMNELYGLKSVTTENQLLKDPSDLRKLSIINKTDFNNYIMKLYGKLLHIF